MVRINIEGMNDISLRRGIKGKAKCGGKEDQSKEWQNLDGDEWLEGGEGAVESLDVVIERNSVICWREHTLVAS